MANLESKSLNYKKSFFSSLLFVAALSLTIASGLLLSAPEASAETTGGIDLTLNVPAICSITVTPADNHTITLLPGNGGTIGSSNIKSVCNDLGGLAVYSTGFTEDTYGNTNLSYTLNNTTYTIPTGAASSPSASQWNMTLAPVSGPYVPEIVSGFNAAHVIPDEYTKVAYRNSATDTGDGAVGANFTATYNVYVGYGQTAGTYTGKVKYLLVHPSTHDAPATPVAVPHQICYYGNNEDEGGMACNSYSANAVATLHASNFSRAGYGFTGWNTKEDGSGTQYGPMETITFTQDMYDNGLMLFANWVQSTGTFQSFNCSSLAPGAVTALTDTRDNDTYAVAKLADGKCWMIENLRLDYDANITTSNTQSNNGAWGGVFAGLAEPESANFTASSTTANSLYTTDTSSADLRIITGSSPSYRFPRYNNNNTASRVPNSASADANIYSYGNYYTWAATIADTTYYSTNNQSITSTSLCPTGWRLPKGGDKSNEANNEWWNLTTTIIGANPANYSSQTKPNYTNNSNTEGTDASKALRRYPTNLVYSGRFVGSSASFRSAHGLYWSSTSDGIISAYLEELSESIVNPGTISDNKYRGFTVRCLAD